MSLGDAVDLIVDDGACQVGLESTVVDCTTDRAVVLRPGGVTMEQIEAIAGLERKKDRLLARMEVIEQLQRTRPESVHLFDQIVRVLPDGVFYDSMEQDGRRVEFEGTARGRGRIDETPMMAEKGGHKHFMYKVVYASNG